VLDRQKPHDLDVMIDRLVLKESVRGRLADSVELALKHGDGMLLLDRGDGQEPRVLSERFACVVCGVSLPPLEPRLFSFNGPHGACPSCGGLGERVVIDPERCVPDPSRSLRDGAFTSWGRRGSVAFATELTRAVEALGVDPAIPFQKLPQGQRDALLHGAEGKGKKKDAYEGVVPRLARLLEQGALEGEDEEREDLGSVGADDLWRFCVTRVCDACHGKRLRPEALAVKLDGRTIAELSGLSLRGLREFLRGLEASGAWRTARNRAIAEPLLRAVIARLGFLIDVGLDYLALDRSTNTLSGGEGQRIRLATQIGAALIGVLYVLDEPSVGLHARDNERLLVALRRLVDIGNSVLVVEHDREAILAADHLIDMGPGAGALGGTIVAQGTPRQVMDDPRSVTGPYLSGSRAFAVPSRRAPGDKVLRVINARAHNLQNITAEIPLGLFVCATGVSGSGKSSLIMDTLLPAVRSVLYGASTPVGACDRVEGMEHIDKVISIDQSPIGRTPRSNAATYTGLFALLREHYASLPEARTRGYKAGRFSFNVKGGRCEACQGDGMLRVEMHFLPDVFVACDACGGRRYGRETLEVRYRGLSIADALDLTVEQALPLFEGIPKMRDKLASLRRVGLGYMPLGQPATTLSGGEAQRVKLAKELARRATGRTLYVLDEPTTGLHFSDIEQLLISLNELCDAGNTVLVIEHNLDVVAQADWVLDLGPEGGERGGLLVAQGTPEEVAATAGSHTGLHLARQLAAAPGKGGKKAKGKARKAGAATPGLSARRARFAATLRDAGPAWTGALSRFMTLQVGSILQNKYRIEELLGQGSIGQVFQGRHLLLKKQVAIKILLPEHARHPEVAARFEREALVGAHVVHPNIAAATDLGQLDDGTQFLVLELVRGVTLREFTRRGALSPRRSVRIALGVARALRCLHEAGIVHRDLKPANIMLAGGDEEVVKLIDFGLAQIDGESKLVTELRDTSFGWQNITTEGQFLGTVAYVAPEVRHGMDAIGARADLYALGVMLFEMLAGRRPFVADGPVELMRQQIHDPAPPIQPLVSEPLPPGLSSLVARLLAKEPEDRPSSAEIVAILEEATLRLGHASERPRLSMADWEARGRVVLPGPDLEDQDPGDRLSQQEISAVLHPPPVSALPAVPAAPEALPTVRDPEPPVHLDTAARAPAPAPRSRRVLSLLLGALALLGVLVGVFGASTFLARPVSSSALATSPSASTSSPSLSPSPSSTSSPSPGPRGLAGTFPATPPSASTSPPPASAASPSPASSAFVSSSSVSPSSASLLALREAAARADWLALQRGLVALGEQGPEVYRQREVQSLLAQVAVELSRQAPTALQQLCTHLAARPSGDGADALYAMSQEQSPSALLFRVREGLTRSLKAGTVSPALRFTLELSWSPCPQKIKLIERAAAEGDGRTRQALEGLRTTECVKRGGCCLKQLPKLAEVITALETQRAAP
jgi:excinuclease ABC subunit A